jgi:hypothetical protein
MNLLAILSVSGLRIVLCVGKFYNFAFVAIALKYANLSSVFFPGFRVLSLFRVGILYASRPLAG